MFWLNCMSEKRTESERERGGRSGVWMGEKKSVEGRENVCDGAEVKSN